MPAKPHQLPKFADSHEMGMKQEREARKRKPVTADAYGQPAKRDRQAIPGPPPRLLVPMPAQPKLASSHGLVKKQLESRKDNPATAKAFSQEVQDTKGVRRTLHDSLAQPHPPVPALKL